MQAFAQSGISLNSSSGSGLMDSDGDHDGCGAKGQQGISKMMHDLTTALNQAKSSSSSSANGYSNVNNAMQSLIHQLNNGASSNLSLKALQADYQNIVTSNQSQSGAQTPPLQTFLHHLMSNFSHLANGSSTGNIINAIKA